MQKFDIGVIAMRPTTFAWQPDLSEPSFIEMPVWSLSLPPQSPLAPTAAATLKLVSAVRVPPGAVILAPTRDPPSFYVVVPTVTDYFHSFYLQLCF